MDDTKGLSIIVEKGLFPNQGYLNVWLIVSCFPVSLLGNEKCEIETNMKRKIFKH